MFFPMFLEEVNFCIDCRKRRRGKNYDEVGHAVLKRMGGNKWSTCRRNHAEIKCVFRLNHPKVCPR